MSEQAIEKKKTDLEVEFEKRQAVFAQIAPREFDPVRMFRLYQLSASRMPGLKQCTMASALVSLMKCTELGLEPNNGLNLAWIIPFKNNKVNPPAVEATFIPGYKGLMMLAQGAANVDHFDVVGVFKEEVDKGLFTIEQGTESRIIHRPLIECERTFDALMAVYAIAYFRDKDSRPVFDWMSKKDIEGIRARSKSKSGPWETDGVAMALKSVVRRLAWRKLHLDPNSRLAKALVYDDDEGPGGMSPTAAAELAPVSIATAVEGMVEEIKNGETKQ